MTDADAAVEVPRLVPARMLNEFAYCPRLFFLEWVEARFAHNADTIEGGYTHRAVDSERGRAPLPEDEEELRRAYSVALSSEALGLTATIDLVESDDRSVRPVDTKKGMTPKNADRSWEPERVQLCAQGLLLREAGYECDHGVLYFSGSRERVTVEFDDALVARTLALLSELRAVATRDTEPPPLIGSSKCPRCSLVGICLPDETNVLTGRAERPRRLIPHDPAPSPLYVTELGAYVGLRDNRVAVTKNREPLHDVRLLDVSQLCVFGNVQVSTQLIRELMRREVPVCWFSYGGWFSGIAQGLPSKHVDLRRKQVAIAAQGGLPIARQVVAGKIRNSRTILRRNAKAKPAGVLSSLKRAAEKALVAPNVDTLLGIEGAAARSYFGAFPQLLRTEHLGGASFTFEGRNRRPPRDAINCLLSFLYSMVVKDLTAATFAVGFDPYIGVYHRPRFGRPALALDLAEEFRPLVAESTAVMLVNNGEIRPSHFVVRAGGVALTAAGRRAVLAAYERRLAGEVRHPLFGYRVSYRRLYELQARLLAAHMLGELPEYVAFVTR